MLYSCQTCHLASRLGINAAVDAMLDAGYPALDISLFGNNGFMLAEDWRETAKALRAKAETRGAVFNQAHAPFGGPTETEPTESTADPSSEGTEPAPDATIPPEE